LNYSSSLGDNLSTFHCICKKYTIWYKYGKLIEIKTFIFFMDEQDEKDEFAEVAPPKNPKKLNHDDLFEDDADVEVEDPLAAEEPDEVSLEDAAEKEEEDALSEDSYDDIDLY
jgi:hypothetical protein